MQGLKALTGNLIELGWTRPLKGALSKSEKPVESELVKDEKVVTSDLFAGYYRYGRYRVGYGYSVGGPRNYVRYFSAICDPPGAFGYERGREAAEWCLQKCRDESDTQVRERLDFFVPRDREVYVLTGFYNLTHSEYAWAYLSLHSNGVCSRAWISGHEDAYVYYCGWKGVNYTTGPQNDIVHLDYCDKDSEHGLAWAWSDD